MKGGDSLHLVYTYIYVYIHMCIVHRLSCARVRSVHVSVYAITIR